MKQQVANGVAQWLRESAPTGVKMMMGKSEFDYLVQTICDQFQASDFNKVDKDEPNGSTRECVWCKGTGDAVESKQAK